MNTTEQPWVPMNSHEHDTLAPWALISTHEHNIMVRWALMRTHGTISPYSWMLLSASECFWVIMNAHESSFTFMSTNECLSTWLNNYWKMLILRMNTLQYFRNIWVQISPNNKNWTFLKSAQKGLLKNVQDCIFRPLGIRKIEKTKVGTVFWYTL